MQSGARDAAAKVSVILPTCDRLEYLEEAIASVLAQTYSNFELMVCDDHSAVDVPAVIARFQDRRITYVRNPSRLGCGGNNHAAYSRVETDLVAHIDDDDLWAPEFLRSMVELLANDPDAVVAFSDKYVVDGTGRINARATEAWSARWGRNQLRPGRHRPFYELAVLTRSLPIAQAAVVRRDALKLTPLPDAGWDWWIAYLLCRTGRAALFDPRRLASYRVHGAQMSSRTGSLELHRELLACYTRVAQDPLLAVIRPAAVRRLADTRAGAAIASMREGLFAEGRALAWEKSSDTRITPRLVVARTITLLPRRFRTALLCTMMWGFRRLRRPI